MLDVKDIRKTFNNAIIIGNAQLTKIRSFGEKVVAA